jgi:ferrous iron transport protein B
VSTRFGTGVTSFLPPGDLRDLLVNGIIAGVGNTLVFLPQILLLFLFIGLLEDTGYLARAAVLDGPPDEPRRAARQVVHSLAVELRLRDPGVMATRTIESPRARC